MLSVAVAVSMTVLLPEGEAETRMDGGCASTVIAVVVVDVDVVVVDCCTHAEE